MRTIDDIPAKHARLDPERECLVCEAQRFTWRELNARVDRLANGLRGLGIEPGEHVAILAQNSHRYVEFYYAAARAGIVAVPLNWRLSVEELGYIVEHSESVALVTDQALQETAVTLGSLAPRLRHTILLDGSDPQMTDYEQLLNESSARPHQQPRDENAMCVLMYTGGTTGRPKGVMLSHRNLLTAVVGCILSGGVLPSDSTLMILPLFHIALWPVLALHYVGGRAVITARFDLAHVLDTIQRERITHVNVVPTIIAFLLSFRDLDRYDLSSLRLLTYAGAPIPFELLMRMKERFPALDLAQGYGLTEASSIVSLLDAEVHRHADTEAQRRRLRSAGREALTTAVRIVDERDREVPRGAVGEISARGANVMLGYWKNPQLTAATLRDGWLHTGDIGFQDADGFIHIIDRKNDMIITGGENVYPREVEDVIYKHPAVLECAVVGLPDAVWGEAITAVVALKPNQTATADEIVALCAEHLAGYKKPRSVDFVDSLPKTSIGKIARREVRDGYMRRTAP
jgi:acyl-CoA synthetase (AMP-forming)/AMP-acid ligase II